VRVEVSAAAQRDIDGIYAYHEERSEIAADRVVAVIIRALRGLGRFPLMGKSGHYPGTREHITARYGYRIVYEVQDDARVINIIRILHSARQWPPEAE
jgi:addiction module RelE/StbE family toxin